jgi:MYXO-CTERM domain-containing protein
MFLHLTPPVALLLAFAPVAEETERPASWDMSIDELREIGLGQSRGDPVVPPDLERDPPRPQHAKHGVIFVNFDGEAMTQGGDSSHNNSSMLFGGAFEAYGGDGSQRSAVIEAVRADWAAYDISVVDSRPASGDYTMNMTGPTNFIGPGVLGVAPLDCMDAMNPNNVTYAFHSANDGFGAAITATTIGQEVAHSFGLEHVDQPADIMNPYNAGGDPSFMDNCTQIVGGFVSCGPQHEAHCGTQTQQNGHQELLEIFGSAIADTAAPTVAITYPLDGDVFSPGTDFEITVDAQDDVQIDYVQLFNNGKSVEMDSSEPYGWEVKSIPSGTYELQVTALDTADNEAMSPPVTIYVGVDPPGSDGTDGEDEDEDEDDEDDADADDDDDRGLPPADDDGKGCGCTADRAPSPLWLLLFAPIVARRRRRSA